MSDRTIDKIEGSHWGYAYLRPHTEKKIAERMRASGICCYLPVMPRARMHHSTKIVTDIPMIPSYIFLCVGLPEATALKKQEKQIIKIELQREPELENTLIEELRALRQCEDLARETPILVNPEIRRGDKVLITSGPLRGLTTDVVRRDDNHNVVIVNITMLQQHVEYSVAAEILRRITS